MAKNPTVNQRALLWALHGMPGQRCSDMEMLHVSMPRQVGKDTLRQNIKILGVQGFLDVDLDSHGSPDRVALTGSGVQYVKQIPAAERREFVRARQKPYSGRPVRRTLGKSLDEIQANKRPHLDRPPPGRKAIEDVVKACAEMCDADGWVRPTKEFGSVQAGIAARMGLNPASVGQRIRQMEKTNDTRLLVDRGGSAPAVHARWVGVLVDSSLVPNHAPHVHDFNPVVPSVEKVDAVVGTNWEKVDYSTDDTVIAGLVKVITDLNNANSDLQRQITEADQHADAAFADAIVDVVRKFFPERFLP